jgi:hypothetical protein
MRSDGSRGGGGHSHPRAARAQPRPSYRCGKNGGGHRVVLAGEPNREPTYTSAEKVPSSLALAARRVGCRVSAAHFLMLLPSLRQPNTITCRNGLSSLPARCVLDIAPSRRPTRSLACPADRPGRLCQGQIPQRRTSDLSFEALELRKQPSGRISCRSSVGEMIRMVSPVIEQA